MIYGFDSRIRYSEVNRRQELTVGAMINYFQDCSLFHSEKIGLGIENLAGKKRAWVLSSWMLQIQKRPVFGQKVRIETWPYDFRGLFGYRNFIMKDEQGECLVRANTLWVYLNTENGRPVRIDEEEKAGYTLESPLDMGEPVRTLSFPENARECPKQYVMLHQLDTNGHVNNGQYVQMAQDWLPADFTASGLRAEYKMQAKAGDEIIPWVAEQEDCWSVALCTPAKKIYAVIEFIKKGK